MAANIYICFCQSTNESTNRIHCTYINCWTFQFIKNFFNQFYMFFYAKKLRKIIIGNSNKCREVQSTIFNETVGKDSKHLCSA